MKIKSIPNEELVLDKIPDPDSQSSDYQELWERFALTMNSYEVCGDFKASSEAKRNVLEQPMNASLTELRCALFSLQRQQRWNSPYSDFDNNKTVIQLLKLIREKVKARELK